jgi:hypothetical protein
MPVDYRAADDRLNGNVPPGTLIEILRIPFAPVMGAKDS